MLDAEFKPLVCTDRVKASVVDKSFITQEIGKEVTGFHCHTYGQIVLGSNAKPIIITHANRVNYKKNPQDLISGVANKQGNVVGVFIHGLLDRNPTITESIMKSLDINPADLAAIKQANAKLLENIKGEVGIATGITPTNPNHPKSTQTPHGHSTGQRFRQNIHSNRHRRSPQKDAATKSAS